MSLSELLPGRTEEDNEKPDKRCPGRNSNCESPDYVRSVDKVNLMHLTLGIAELVLSFTLRLPLLSVNPAAHRAPYCVQCSSNGKTVLKKSPHLLRLLCLSPLHSAERAGAAATLYQAGARFESRLGHRLFRSRYFVVFFSSSMQMLG